MSEHRRPRIRRRMLLMMMLVLATVSWLSCSIEKNYQVLSFFFDGVPDPNAPVTASSLDAAKAAGLTYYSHKPYAENACKECHENPSNIFGGRTDSSICMKCHAEIVQQHEVMHGPVAAVACLWCHKPHESVIENLLRHQVPQLCRQCHIPGLQGAPQQPDHIQTKDACLDCHSGHGGDNRYFLKDVSNRPDPIDPANEAAGDGE